MVSRVDIKRVASDVGFDLCGVARCRRFDDDESFFNRWVESGCASSLEYLRRNGDKRFDVTRLVEGAGCVVVCAVGYRNRAGDGYPEGFDTKVASYACMEDYHTTIRSMLRSLLERLREKYPSLRGRVFTDSAPLLEKRYAVEAGLGWIGRQSLLVTPRFGTYVLLGEAVLCDECDSYDEPVRGAGCGTCRRCVDACPNGAVRERHIDTSLCISCATVERGNGLENLHGWIFGCDECQSCCPYNRSAPYCAKPAFAPLFDPLEMDSERWMSMTEDEFEKRFAPTPLSRSGLERIRSNVGRKP